MSGDVAKYNTADEDNFTQVRQLFYVSWYFSRNWRSGDSFATQDDWPAKQKHVKKAFIAL